MLVTFGLTTFAWIFFRAENLTHAFSYIKGIFSPSLLSMPTLLPPSLLALIVIFVGIEWIGRREQYAIASIGLKWPVAFRWSFYYAIIFAIIQFSGNEQAFIYFQF